VRSLPKEKAARGGTSGLGEGDYGGRGMSPTVFYPGGYMAKHPDPKSLLVVSVTCHATAVAGGGEKWTRGAASIGAAPRVHRMRQKTRRA